MTNHSMSKGWLDDDQRKILNDLIKAAEKIGNLFADQHEGKAFNELADAIEKAKEL